MSGEEIARVLSEHQLHDSMNLCRGCHWRPRAGQGSLRIQHRAHLAHVLAPLVEQAEREAAATAWDEGYMSGWDDRNSDEHEPLPAGEQHDTPNPYRAERVRGAAGGGADV